jgi:5-amino-6-(5-phosphoribosylamino)uracil reductase
MADRPYTLMSCSVSLDGYLGDRTPRCALSNAADFDRVDEVRASCDAIVVGAVTVRTDNPRLLVRSRARREERTARAVPPSPKKITVTNRADLDARSNFFTAGEAEKLVYTPSPRVADARAQLGPAATIVDGSPRVRMRWLTEELGDRGVDRLIVEGGGIVHTQFLADDLVDELHLVVALFHRRLERSALRARRPLPVECEPARDARRGAPDRRRRAAALRALISVPRGMTE